MNEIKNGGQVITSEKLNKEACELTAIHNQLRLIERTLSSLEYNRMSGDNLSLKFQVQSGILGEINDVVIDIKEKVAKISDNICPD